MPYILISLPLFLPISQMWKMPPSSSPTRLSNSRANRKTKSTKSTLPSSNQSMRMGPHTRYCLDQYRCTLWRKIRARVNFGHVFCRIRTWKRIWWERSMKSPFCEIIGSSYTAIYDGYFWLWLAWIIVLQVKVDWDRYVDEDEENEGFDTSAVSFSLQVLFHLVLEMQVHHFRC